MSLLKIGGKTDNNDAKPFRVDNSGNSFVKREMTTGLVDLIVSMELRDTSAHDSVNDENTRKAFDNRAIKSLRFHSTLDQPVIVTLTDDYHNNDAAYLFRLNNEPIRFTIPKASSVGKRYIVTSDDIPELDYLRYIKFTFKCDTAPTVGMIKCAAVVKS